MIGKRKHIRQLKRKNSTINVKQLASCQGKIRYNCYEDALSIATQKPSVVKTYKCKFCGYYHMGRLKTAKNLKS